MKATGRASVASLLIIIAACGGAGLDGATVKSESDAGGAPAADVDAHGNSVGQNDDSAAQDDGGHRCGDGVRDLRTEECDLGPANLETGVCNAKCRTQDILLGGIQGDVIPQWNRKIAGPHSVAGMPSGLAVVLFNEQVRGEVSVGFQPKVAISHPGGGISQVALSRAPGYDPRIGAITAISDSVVVVALRDSDSPGGIFLQRIDVLANLAGATRPSSWTGNAAIHDLDIVWTGSQLVVSWQLGEGLQMRIFDGSLKPAALQDESFATTREPQSMLRAASLNGIWAAAWVSMDENSRRTIHAKAGATTWSVGPLPSGAEATPATVEALALTELDASHLALTYIERRATNDSRARAAILSPSTPGNVEPFDIVAPSAGERLSAWTVSRHESSLWLGWEERSLATADPSSAPSSIWMKELEWSPSTATLAPRGPERLPIPRTADHRTGKQSFPVFVDQAGKDLVAVWRDVGSFGAGQRIPDIALARMSLPLLRFD